MLLQEEVPMEVVESPSEEVKPEGPKDSIVIYSLLPIIKNSCM